MIIHSWHISNVRTLAFFIIIINFIRAGNYVATFFNPHAFM